ncbi:CBS domain-containing protein [Salipiger mangrovisoli]|uniref:CBS domain-containing protein n=1 Tax=Salipiger mangrovisoli TaxID=2865933 RepID=A0ABR9X5J1_9RHOB|nr:CBS domain-containing protein [Salipiger mangrovisoli]MBE9638789.1 CBS domain-containing protein [Salipiger mangrovisoli]
MKVSEAMRISAEWVSADTPVSEIASQMAKDNLGALPVGRDGRLVGMITDRDLALRVVAKKLDPETTLAIEVMSPGIVFCRTEESVEDAIHLMEQKQIRRLPVLDEKKRLVGMLSLGDIAHATSLQLAGELARAVSAHHQ